jgi:hypothetical protein
MQDQRPASETNNKTKKPARTSLFRNRRRANRLPAMELRAVQADFESYRSTEAAADSNLLPRAEATDAVLIGIVANVRFLADEIAWVRKKMGIATTSVQGPFLLENGDANVRQFIEKRKTA